MRFYPLDEPVKRALDVSRQMIFRSYGRRWCSEIDADFDDNFTAIEVSERVPF